VNLGCHVANAIPAAPCPNRRAIWSSLQVGDLDLDNRQRGRTAGRTTARWLTVGVDDGSKLLNN